MRWLGHVLMLKQALCWEVEDFKRRPGRPCTDNTGEANSEDRSFKEWN